MRGLPIDEYCDDAKLSLRDRLKLFIDVCRAVQHAHQKGIIHRDVKPSNILITLHDSVPVVKVIDFGIAKALDHELTERTLFTRFAALVGTPVYMSPEQAELSGLDIDTRSDVYSLGVTLYKLLVGVTPFDGRTLKSAGLDEMRRIIREDEPSRPSQKVSTLDNELASTVSDRRGTTPHELTLSMRRELDWIVMKALEKDRNRRYQGAADLAADVQRYLDNAPVVACPPTMLYRCKKTYDRNRAAIIGIAVIVCALVATSAISVWQVLEVRRAWHASQIREQQANDLLEATHLQAAVSAFRQSDFANLAKSTAALTSAQRNTAKTERESGSLANLLRRCAEPRPRQSFPDSASVLDISVPTDGTRMATVDANGQFRLWDLSPSSSGTVLGTHGEPAHAVAISPDGMKAVSGSTTGSVWFWDLEQGIVVKKLKPVSTGIETIVWAPDGRHIAIGGRYSEVWVCDADGVEKFRIENDDRHESLLFSSDSKRLFVPTRSNIDVWNVGSGTRQTSYATDPISNIRAMCWAGPAKRWLAAGERFSETLVILHRDTGERLGTLSLGAEYAQHLAASKDGKWLAATYAGGHTQLIQLSQSATGEVNGTLQMQFVADEVSAIATREPRWTIRWLGDSRRFVTAGSDGRVRLWDVNEIQPARVLPVPDKAADGIRAAFPLREGELAYFFYGQEGVKDRPFHFDYYGKPTSPSGVETPFAVHAISNSSAGRLVAVAGAQRVAIVSLDTGRTVGEFRSPFAWHWRVAISADATVVAASSSDNEVTAWRTANQWSSAEQLNTWTALGQRAPLIADARRTLILGDLENSEITEWDLKTGAVRRKYDAPTKSTDFCVSHRGDLLAVATSDGIRVWDRRTGSAVLDVATLSAATSLAFFPDDRVLVSGHADRRILAWHLPTGQPLGTLFAPSKSLAGEPTCLLPAKTGNSMVAWYTRSGPLRVVVLGMVAPQ